MGNPSHILICFAVKEEASPFLSLVKDLGGITVLVTGMGAANAKREFLQALNRQKPSCVITCGFAGGLNHALPPESVVMDAANDFPLTEKLLQAGAQQASFHCAEKVAVTASEKSALFAQTKCDAVEMESGAIRTLCIEQGIPAATVRVISDAANEDLPLNFNELMTPQMTMNFGKLAWTLLKSPGKIPELMRFQKRVQSSAQKLGQTLFKAVNPAA